MTNVPGPEVTVSSGPVMGDEAWEDKADQVIASSKTTAAQYGRLLLITRGATVYLGAGAIAFGLTLLVGQSALNEIFGWGATVIEWVLVSGGVALVVAAITGTGVVAPSRVNCCVRGIRWRRHRPDRGRRLVEWGRHLHDDR